MSDYAKHEAVAEVVILEAMGIPLPDIIQVANPQSDAPETEVQHQHLSETQCIARMSTQDVVASTLLRNLIITLSKLRTEHHAQHRQVSLVAGSHGKLPEVKRIGTTC